MKSLNLEKSVRQQLADQEKTLKPKTGRVKKAKEQSFFSKISALRNRRGKSRVGGIRNNSFGRGRFKNQSHKFSQRVVTKTRVVRNRGKGKGGLSLHVKYVEREGVGLSKDKGKAFNQNGILSKEERDNWIKEATQDRHHFRIIVSPENAHELDLNLFANRLMGQMEKDLDSKLSWIGVAHYNTDNQHVHLIIRGKNDQGEDLVINRDYISNGMRYTAQKIATEELGYRLEHDIKTERERNITKERFTTIDKQILTQTNIEKSEIDLRNPKDLSSEKLRYTIGRLKFLSTLGLAKQTEVGVWEIDSNLEKKLKDLGNRGDIIKRIHEQLKASNERGEEIELHTLNKDQHGKILSVNLNSDLGHQRDITIRCSDGKIRIFNLNSDSSSALKSGQIVKIGRYIDISKKDTFYKLSFKNETNEKLYLRVEDKLSLKDQVKHEGATWVDEHLANKSNRRTQTLTVFETELEDAMQGRLKRLRQWGLVNEKGDLVPGFLDKLKSRQMDRGRASGR